MTEVQQLRGGFGVNQLSPQAQRTVAELEAHEAQAAHSARLLEETWKAHNGIPTDAQRRATWEANNERLAIQMAIDEGTPVHDAVLRGHVGHTRAEFVELAQARQDHEDALREAADRRAYQAWKRDTAGWEQEPTRAERIAEQRAERSRAQAVVWREKAEERRAERDRRRELERAARAAVEPAIARVLDELGEPL